MMLITDANVCERARVRNYVLSHGQNSYCFVMLRFH
jgi:hypothetical protein